MGFWPFGGGKKHRLEEKSVPRTDKTEVMAHAEKPSKAQAAPLGRRSSRRGYGDTIKQSSQTALDPSMEKRQARTVERGKVDTRKDSSTRLRKSDAQIKMYQQHSLSQSSIQPEDFTALPEAPTLYARRNDYDPHLARRKSSKRKAEDYQREREIRAMSQPIPIPKRPVAFSGSGPLRRDTKNVPGDLNHKLRRPTSEVSLPMAESLSEMDEPALQGSFKIGFLAALSPRPTLRYDSNPRPNRGKAPSRSRLSSEQAIVEEDLASSRKRIDDLADDLNASGLRELMERDRKRRERKRESDKAKLQRKLERRAEKQREEELRGKLVAAEQGGPSFSSAPIAEPKASGAVRPRAEEVEAMSRVQQGQEESTQDNPFGDAQVLPHQPSTTIRNPFEDEKETDIMDDPLEQDSEDEPPVPVKSPLRNTPLLKVKTDAGPEQATLSPPSSPLPKAAERSSLSQASLRGKEMLADVPESVSTDRRASDQSSQQLSSWASFFKRGARRKPSATEQDKNTPSEFSNTSRESFRRQPPPAITQRTFKQTESSVPRRTMSKFREDLPELPLSPPDSRVQSPEAGPGELVHHATTLPQQDATGSVIDTQGTRSLTTSSSNPMLERGRQDDRTSSFARSMDLDSATASGMILSHSLASVDSEGSWLSGKALKRGSGQLVHPLRQSQGSLQPEGVEALEPEAQDIVDDPYLSRLSPAPEDRRPSAVSGGRRASSTVLDLQERGGSPTPDVPPLPQDGDEVRRGNIGRQPTLVKQTSRAKSKEGLLNEYRDSDAYSFNSDLSMHGARTPEESPEEHTHEVVVLERAQSVDYKKHARHISAGSARLLDIRRSSVQTGDYPSTPVLRSPTTDLPQQEEEGPGPTTETSKA